ncbi:MAG: hypothetical protein KC643_18585 [Nitrospira sp.]|nr:hypothetical protein [Nitrospira sp.]GJL62076.1 MAG: hypothetical protein NPIRA04_07300 [Nitrospirales bacterium]
MKQKQWIGMYRRWNSTDERKLIRLYYEEKTFEDIATKLNRESLEVILRLIELRILETDTLAQLWDDQIQQRKAA